MLVAIAESDKATDSARVSACVALLDRGWGKPDKTHHHDGNIRQHIISDRPLTPGVERQVLQGVRTNRRETLELEEAEVR